MGNPAVSMTGGRVWVVVGADSEVRAMGASAVDAWRNFFNQMNTLETLDDLSRSLGHEDFRCTPCRLVPDDDAVWEVAATESGDRAAEDRMEAGRRVAVRGLADG